MQPTSYLAHHRRVPGMSFLLSGMEAGVFALSRLRIRQQMRAAGRRPEVLHGLPGKPGELPLDNPGGQHAGQFPDPRLAHRRCCTRALGAQRSWFVVVFAAIVFLFYALFDLLPKMLFRTLSEPAMPAAGAAFPVWCISLLRPLVALVEWCLGCCCAGGRQGVHRPPVRQPRRAAAGHAGIRPGAHLGGAHDDQPRARFADAHRAAGRSAAGDRRSPSSADTPVSDVLEWPGTAVTRLPVWETRDGRRRIVWLASSELVAVTSQIWTRPSRSRIT